MSGELIRSALLGLVQPIEARPDPRHRRLAVVASGPDGTDILLVPVPQDGAPPGSPQPLPRSRAGETAARHTPRWLAEDDTLLHVVEDHQGRHRLAVADPADPGRDRRLPLLPGVVEELLPAPDCRSALLICADEGSDRDGMNLGLPVRFDTDVPPGPERHRPGGALRRLLLVDLATGAFREVGPVGLSVWNVAWRGGRTAVATVSEEALPAGYYLARLAELDLEDRSARDLHRPEGGQLSCPALSPDGARAAFVEGISIVAGRPAVVDLRTGAVRPLPGGAALAEDVTWLQWYEGSDPSRDGSLWFAGWDGTGSRFGLLHPARGEVEVLWRQQATLTGAAFQPSVALAHGGDLAAAVLTAPGLPPEAVVARTGGGARFDWTPATALNSLSPSVPALAAVTTAETDWHAPDGLLVHGLLLSGPDSGTDHGPRPLAVLVHGGPAWLWSAGFAPGDVCGMAMVLAGDGYDVQVL